MQRNSLDVPSSPMGWTAGWWRVCGSGSEERPVRETMVGCRDQDEEVFFKQLKEVSDHRLGLSLGTLTSLTCARWAARQKTSRQQGFWQFWGVTS